MAARGNKWLTRWPGLMSSVADGSTYSAPVEQGSDARDSNGHPGEPPSPDFGDSSPGCFI
jgi:hypothetical protein